MYSIIIVSLATAFIQGFLSMGFQIVGSRLLYPYFGSTVVVWAFLISTFLLGFSCGAFWGGHISRRPSGHRRSTYLIFACGILSFWIVPLAGKPLLTVLSAFSFFSGLIIACLVLFLMPVITLSAILPLVIEVVAENGFNAGSASGLIFGTSTLGNICGVLATAFLLVPNFGVSKLTLFWAGFALLCFLLTRFLLTRAKPAITNCETS